MSKRAKRPAAKRPRAALSWAVWFPNTWHPYSTHAYLCFAKEAAVKAWREFGGPKPSIVRIEIYERPARKATKRPEARG